MKKSFRYLLSVVIVFVVIVVFSACSKDDPDYITAYVASLDGTQAIPANSTAGFGDGNVTYDSIQNKMTYTIAWRAISGTPTSIYFEKGTRGTADYAMIPVTDYPAKTEGAVSGSITLDPDYESALLNEGFYVTITTSAYSDGEIRGQLLKQR